MVTERDVGGQHLTPNFIDRDARLVSSDFLVFSKNPKFTPRHLPTMPHSLRSVAVPGVCRNHVAAAAELDRLCGSMVDKAETSATVVPQREKVKIPKAPLCVIPEWHPEGRPLFF